MYPSKVCVQAFWYFVPFLDIQPEQSKNDKPTRKKSGSRLLELETTIHVLFFLGKSLIRIYGSVVKVSCSE